MENQKKEIRHGSDRKNKTSQDDVINGERQDTDIHNSKINEVKGSIKCDVYLQFTTTIERAKRITDEINQVINKYA